MSTDDLSDLMNLSSVTAKSEKALTNKRRKEKQKQKKDAERRIARHQLQKAVAKMQEAKTTKFIAVAVVAIFAKHKCRCGAEQISACAPELHIKYQHEQCPSTLQILPTECSKVPSHLPREIYYDVIEHAVCPECFAANTNDKQLTFLEPDPNAPVLRLVNGDLQCPSENEQTTQSLSPQESLVNL